MNMKKIFFLFVIAVLISYSVRAQVPQTISYQGFYTDGSGNPVTGGPHKIAFKFLDAASNVENTGLAREIENVTINKGIISVVIGGGDPSNTTAPDNAPLPFNVWTQAFKIQVLVDGTSIGAAVPLTTVPYAFVAGSVDGNNITGTVSATIISGNVSVVNGGTGSTTASDARTALGLAVGTNVQAYDFDLDDLADGELTGSKVGAGISATNLSGTVAVANGGTGSATPNDARTTLGLAIGTNVQAYDLDLDDLADGSLTGSKVGSGVSAGNLSGSVAVANGGTGSTTAANARTALGLAIGTDVQAFDADIADLADGILNTTGNITTAGGLHVGSSTVPVTDNLEVDGYTKLGGAGITVTTSTPGGAAVAWPSIRVLKIAGTCAAQDATATVTLSGLAETKILSIEVLVENSTGDYVPAGYTFTTGLLFNYFYQNNILSIRNMTGSSANLAGRPFKATIIYEE
jgi:hypothetical protein